MTRTTFDKGMNLIYSTWLELKRPAVDVVNQWFEWLKPLPDELFAEACKRLCLRGGYRPQNIIGEIATEINKMRQDEGIDAREAHRKIEKYFSRLYSPDMSSASWEAIKSHLPEELHEMALRWGQEIYYNQNPTAIRAQFIKEYEAMQERRFKQKYFPTPKFDFEQLGDALKQIEGLTK